MLGVGSDRWQSRPWGGHRPLVKACPSTPTTSPWTVLTYYDHDYTGDRKTAMVEVDRDATWWRHGL